MPPPSLIFIPKTGCPFAVDPSTAGEFTVSPLSQEESSQCVDTHISTLDHKQSKAIIDQISTALQVDTKDSKAGLLRLVQVENHPNSSIAFEYVSHAELAQDPTKYQERDPRCKILSLQILLRNAEQDSNLPEAFKQYFQKKIAQDSSYSIFMHEPILQEKFLKLRGTFAYPHFYAKYLPYYLRQILLLDKIDVRLFLESFESFLKTRPSNDYSSLYLSLVKDDKTMGDHNITFLLGNSRAHTTRHFPLPTCDTTYSQNALVVLKALIQQCDIQYPSINNYLRCKISQTHQPSDPYWPNKPRTESLEDTFEAFENQRKSQNITHLRIIEYTQRCDEINSRIWKRNIPFSEENDIESEINDLQELKKEIQHDLFLAERTRLLAEDLRKLRAVHSYHFELGSFLDESRNFISEAQFLLTDKIPTLEQEARLLCIRGEIEATENQIQKETAILEALEKKFSEINSHQDSDDTDKLELLANVSTQIKAFQKNLLFLNLRIEKIKPLLKNDGSPPNAILQDLDQSLQDCLVNYENLKIKFQDVSASAKSSLSSRSTALQNYLQANISMGKPSLQKRLAQLTQDSQDILTIVERFRILKQPAEEMANDSIVSLHDAREKAKKRILALEELEGDAQHFYDKMTQHHESFQSEYMVVEDWLASAKILILTNQNFHEDYTSQIQSILDEATRGIKQASDMIEQYQGIITSVQAQKLSAKTTVEKLEHRIAQIGQAHDELAGLSSEKMIEILASTHERLAILEKRAEENEILAATNLKDSQHYQSRLTHTATSLEHTERRLTHTANTLKHTENALKHIENALESAKKSIRAAEEAQHTAEEALSATKLTLVAESSRLKLAKAAQHAAEASQHAAEASQYAAEVAQHAAEAARHRAEVARNTAESSNLAAISENQSLRNQLAEQQASNLALAGENARLTAQSQQPPSLIQRFFDSIAGFFRRIFRRNPNRAQNNPVGGIEGRGLHATETPPAQAPNADPPPNYANHADFSSGQEMVPPPAYPEAPLLLSRTQASIEQKAQLPIAWGSSFQ